MTLGPHLSILAHKTRNPLPVRQQTELFLLSKHTIARASRTRVSTIGCNARLPSSQFPLSSPIHSSKTLARHKLPVYQPTFMSQVLLYNQKLFPFPSQISPPSSPNTSFQASTKTSYSNHQKSRSFLSFSACRTGREEAELRQG